MESSVGADKENLNSQDNLFRDGNDKGLIGAAEEGRAPITGDGDDTFYLRLLETDMFCRLWHD